MPSQRHRIRLPDGTIRFLEDGEQLPNGAAFLVPLALRDSSALRDAATTDAARADQARAEMIRDIANAWESPQATARRQLEPEWSTLSPSAQQRQAEQAWEEMRQDLGRAWEGRPPVPTGSLVAGSLQASQVSAYSLHVAGYEPDAREQYIQELSSAWERPNGWR